MDKLRGKQRQRRGLGPFYQFELMNLAGGDRTGSHQKVDGFRREREGLTNDHDDRDEL